jgi:mRNA-degrading endonuclease YafQ of YafQ-DinJ toxin-antitoxin module
LKKHLDLKDQYYKILKILAINPLHPSLRLHKLKGSLGGLQSASINISYRVVLNFIVKKDLIMPVDIGSHDEVY